MAKKVCQCVSNGCQRKVFKDEKGVERAGQLLSATEVNRHRQLDKAADALKHPTQVSKDMQEGAKRGTIREGKQRVAVSHEYVDERDHQTTSRGICDEFGGEYLSISNRIIYISEEVEQRRRADLDSTCLEFSRYSRP